MSQVDSVVPPQLRAAKALWLVLGAHRIEWGAVASEGEADVWVSVGSIDVLGGDGQEMPQRADLLKALRELPEQPFDTWAVGISLNVCLADYWVPAIVLPWNSQQTLGKVAFPLACAHFAIEGFQVESDDLVRVDDAPYGASRLLVAYPGDVLQWLEISAQRWGRKLGSVRSTALAGWSLTCGTSKVRALVVLGDDDLVFLGSIGGRASQTGLSDYHRIPWRQAVEDPSEAGIKSQASLWLRAWQRLCLRQPVWAGLGAVALIDGRLNGEPKGLEALPHPFVAVAGSNSGSAQFPQGAMLCALSTNQLRHALDAVSPSHQWRWHKVLLTLIMVIGLVWLGAQALQLAKDGHGMEAQLEKRLHASAPRSVETRWTREEIARVQVVNRAVRQLNLPLRDLLRALEPPRDIQVAILSVDSTGQSGGGRMGDGSNLRIVALASSSADMTRYVAFISDRKPFSGAALSRHEWVDGVQGQARLARFTVEAVWTD